MSEQENPSGEIIETDSDGSNDDTVEMEINKQTQDELGQLLHQAETKAQENWDKLLRVQAEMENVRRRAERDVENAHKYALEKFAAELLPVKDSLELGAAAAQQDDTDIAKLREGTELTLKLMDGVMSKFGITLVDPLDQPFDPELHQAMSMIESPDKEPNTVVAVMQKGYTLNERLLRPAMVVVAKEPEK
ncbi:MAG: nucleotide exchange factor GrpE [Gammaproteobacteria bacterium]|jgi:molecular chaperone GrpE